MNVRGYAAPSSLDEAIALLAGNPGARVLAGGLGLLVEPNSREKKAPLLVDLRKVYGLTGIDEQPDGRLKIGAMTTLAQIAASPLVRLACPALGEAARAMGDAQLRNRATLGGHLASVDPDADLAAVVLALDADVEIIGPRGPRTVLADQLAVGPSQTIIQPDEVLASMSVPARVARSAIAYERSRHPATLYAICGVSANVRLGRTGRVAACLVAVTGAPEFPVRLRSVEKILLKTPGDAETVAAASAVAGAGLTFRDDLFASAEYRRHLTRVLTERALNRAFKDAGADIQAEDGQGASQVASDIVQV